MPPEGVFWRYIRPSFVEAFAMSRTTSDTQPKEPRGWYRHSIAPTLSFDPSPRVETEAARRDREWEQEKARLRQMGADL